MKHWAFAAVDGLKDRVLALKDCAERDHLLYMIDTVDHGMSDTKANRWLGWIQASLVLEFHAATLEEMKQHNKKYSDTAEQPAKGEKWRCACGDLNYPNETCAMCNQSAPQPSDPADAKKCGCTPIDYMKGIACESCVEAQEGPADAITVECTEMGTYTDYAFPQPAKGDVPLCEKYGDGCNFPDCPCDVDDPLTQQPFKGECFADALDEDIKEARTPQPSDAQQASRASNPADAVCDCGSNVDNRQPHHDECAIYATQPTAQRHDGPSESLRRFKDNLAADNMVDIPSPVDAAHGAGAAVEAVAEVVGFDRGLPDLEWVNKWPLSKGDKLYTAPTQQRSEQVAVSAAVVARALVECPISLVAESRWEWIAKYINTALSKQVAGGGGVDVDGLLKMCDFADKQGIGNVSTGAIREVLSTQPLLSDQPAGVSEGAAKAYRLLDRFEKIMARWRGTEVCNDLMAKEYEAALHSEQAKDGAQS